MRDEIPFPIGAGSTLRSVRPPGNPLSCRGGGDAPVWERPVSGSSAQIIGRPDLPAPVSSSAKQILSSGNPLSHRGKFRIAEHSSTRKSPFLPGWGGTPLSGAPRFRLKRSDHRKAGSFGPGQQQRETNPLQWKSPFPAGGWFRIAECSSTRKRPFLPG